MSSADLVQRSGLGLAFCREMNASMAAISSLTDVWAPRLICFSASRAKLLGAGVRIHLFRDELLHAKHVTVDGEIVLIGSSNVDVRSFLLNAEVTLVGCDAAVTGEVVAVQHGHVADSDLLTPAAWAARPYPVKLFENLAQPAVVSLGDTIP